jgi:hypothetical protein
MNTFTVVSAGNIVGDYEAETADEALQAMVEDAGYSSLDELCAAGASKPEEFEVFEANA